MTLQEAVTKKVADLKIQAMMFDMDIDFETLELIPKTKDTTPIWIKRWNEKRASADFNEYFDIDKE